MSRVFTFVIIAVLVSSAGLAGTATEVKVTTLSTMLTELQGVGEWGYAALVEVDGKKILFDTGARPGTVLKNVGELGLDLGDVETVVLSHHHWDHTGGLVTLRKHFGDIDPTALKQAHVGEGIFLPRSMDPEAAKRFAKIGPPKELMVKMSDIRAEYENLGGVFSVHDEPQEILPGVWVTGPIPRVHDERNWTKFNRIERDGGFEEDTLPEDQALVLETADGLVVVAGCGHSGIVNTMEYAREITGDKPILAVIGGFHMMSLTDEKVAWTGEKMREYGVQHVIGAHCTGINAVTGLREAGGLDRGHAVVGAVGSTFVAGEGIKPGLLTR